MPTLPESNQIFGKSSGDTPEFFFFFGLFSSIINIFNFPKIFFRLLSKKKKKRKQKRKNDLKYENHLEIRTSVHFSYYNRIVFYTFQENILKYKEQKENILKHTHTYTHRERH